MAHFWLALTVIAVALLFWKWRRPKNFPPGPWALPILGNFLQVDYRNPIPDFRKMAKRYGNVYSIFLGYNQVVVLNGFQAVKEALVDHATEFSDRPEDPVFIKINKLKGVITVPYGQPWKEQRRFTLMLLRNFGLGKKSMETRIMEEARYLVKYFEDEKGNSFDPKPMITNVVSNVICSILFGQRFDYGENTFGKILILIDKSTRLVGGLWGELYNAMPFIRGLPLPFQNIFKNTEEIRGFLRNIVEEHRRTLTPGEQRDIVDYYLEEIDKRKNDGSSFDEGTLLSLMVDLFIAGTDTTTNTMRWALLLMMVYPDIQAKCYKEIESTLNGNKDLCYEDRLRMPYTQAVIHEIQRFGVVVPLGVPHALIKDASFSGYTIPQGTRVISDLSSVLCDESQWKFPHEFNPSNFLNDNGEFEKREAFLPFSTGPRVCLGENLARMEIFLFFTALLRCFEFFWPDKSTAPVLTPVFGIVQSPPPFKVGLKSRRD